MLHSEGIIHVDVENTRMVVDISSDFIEYYQWFLERKYWVNMNSPLYGAHITIGSSNHHENVDWKRGYEKYNGEPVGFEYDENIITGGRTKGFYLFYVKVFSETIDTIKKDIGILESSDYKGLHITLAVIGKKGCEIIPWWPELIRL